MFKKIFLFASLIFFGILLTACIKISEKKDFGGVFKSLDKGETFAQKVLISSPKQTLFSIGYVNIVSMAMDPQDHEAVYIGTYKDGLYYTYDGAESWHKAKSLENRQINSIVINPVNKCNIFATSGNKIFVSKDCNRNYYEIYNDPRSEAVIGKIVIDDYNPAIILAGTSYGDIIRSENSGDSWVNISNFKYEVTDIIINKDIVINKKDDDVIFVATKKGLYRTRDNGKNWDDLTKKLKEGMEKSGTLNIKKLILSIDVKDEDSIIVLTEKSILKSFDHGETWSELNLISQPGKVKLYSIAINPKNANEIYYGTATSLVRSQDGGKSWISDELPSSRLPLSLIVDPVNPKVLYMGMYKID